MGVNKEKQSVVNIELARFLGLYQNLNPDTTPVLFGFNVYQIINSCFGLPMILASLFCPFGLYYFQNDLIAFIYYLGCIINYLFSCYKIFIIIYCAKDLWICIESSNYNFLSYQHYNISILKAWRRRSTIVSLFLIIAVIPSSIFWNLCPHIFNETFVTIKNIDGSYSKYRLNVINLYLIVSDETNNKYFNFFYFFEIIICVFFLYFTIIFDFLMVSMCCALSSQLETICDGIKSLKYNWSKDNLNDTTDRIQFRNKFDLTHDLKIILKDHQNVIKKLTVFYNIFRPAILSQIIIVSASHVICWFIAAMIFFGGLPKDSVLPYKLFTVLPLFTYQSFMTCHLLNTINEKKESITFALYCCNWTDMNMISKKLILLAMKMNNAHQLKLKFTKRSVINLELFGTTMRICYSIFSMLIKYHSKN